MKKKINYREGDVFVLPLRSEGFARGLVARMNGGGIVFGCFFGPKLNGLADAMSRSDLQAGNAIFTCRFGDLGLLKQEWKVIGKLSGWSRDRWPLPPFLHVDQDGGAGFIRRYDEDSLKFISEERVALSRVSKTEFPEDGLFGYGAVEIILTRLLK
jgi:hypothetical protein